METTSLGQKKKIYTNFCRQKLGMKSDEFDTCWRAGKVDPNKKDYCRPLIIQMADVAAVNEWTKDGKGLQTESGYWINNDLCAADRRSNFLTQEETKTAKKQKLNDKRGYVLYSNVNGLMNKMDKLKI